MVGVLEIAPGFGTEIREEAPETTETTMTIDEILKEGQRLEGERPETLHDGFGLNVSAALIRFWYEHAGTVLEALVALKRKNETLRNAWETGETDRGTVLARVQELEQELSGMVRAAQENAVTASEAMAERNALRADRDRLKAEVERLNEQIAVITKPRGRDAIRRMAELEAQR